MNSSGRQIRPPEGSHDVYPRGDFKQYPWFPLPDGYVLHFEVKCRRCGTGLCGGSSGMMEPGAKMPVVEVPICPTCFREARLINPET